MKLSGNQVFFDDKTVLKAVGKGAKKALSKWGAYIRRSAKQSIRKRKKASAPGSPPSSHTGTLKRNIYFAYDKTKNRVVVGPVLAGSVSGAPRVLEYGGTAVVGKLTKPREFKVGQSAPIREVSNGKGGSSFVWAKITSKAQATRASRLFFNRNRKRTIKVLARPYMKPALIKNLHVGAVCFANCLRK